MPRGVYTHKKAKVKARKARFTQKVVVEYNGRPIAMVAFGAVDEAVFMRPLHDRAMIRLERRSWED